MTNRGQSGSAARRARCLSLAGVLGLCACAAPTPKSYIVLLESTGGDRPSLVTVTNAKGTRTLHTPGDYVGLSEDPHVAPRRAPRTMIERDFSPALAAEPEAPRRYLLYFLAGGVELTGESRALLSQILAEVKLRSVPDISIVGHTDTKGTAESNAALAARRAKVVKTLVVDAGLDPDLVAVTSHGERSPLVATADDVDEPRNRRVEVIIR